MLVLAFLVILPIVYCCGTYLLSSLGDTEKNSLNRNVILPILSEIGWQYLIFLDLGYKLVVGKWSHRFKNSSSLVVLLPGYTETDFIFRGLIRRLDKFPYDYTCIKYNPLIGDLRETSNKLSIHLRELIDKNNYRQINLVGHSMGGLIAHEVSRKLSPEINYKVVTIACPFKGTSTAKYGLGKCAKQMRLKSRYIKEHQINTSHPKDLLNIYSEIDNLISPRNSAHLDLANSLKFDLLHNSLMLNPVTCSTIVNFLNEQHTE